MADRTGRDEAELEGVSQATISRRRRKMDPKDRPAVVVDRLGRHHAAVQPTFAERLIEVHTTHAAIHAGLSYRAAVEACAVSSIGKATRLMAEYVCECCATYAPVHGAPRFIARLDAGGTKVWRIAANGDFIGLYVVPAKPARKRKAAVPAVEDIPAVRKELWAGRTGSARPPKRPPGGIKP